MNSPATPVIPIDRPLIDSKVLIKVQKDKHYTKDKLIKELEHSGDFTSDSDVIDGMKEFNSSSYSYYKKAAAHEDRRAKNLSSQLSMGSGSPNTLNVLKEQFSPERKDSSKEAKIKEVISLTKSYFGREGLRILDIDRISVPSDSEADGAEGEEPKNGS